MQCGATHEVRTRATVCSSSHGRSAMCHPSMLPCLRPSFSAQNYSPSAKNPQVSAIGQPEARDREPRQVSVAPGKPRVGPSAREHTNPACVSCRCASMVATFTCSQ